MPHKKQVAQEVHDPVEVLNLLTGETQTYTGISAQAAVISAYAQSKHDWNTWDYQARYAPLIHVEKQTIACGDFAAQIQVEKETCSR